MSACAGILCAAAYENETDPEIKAFPAFVKDNKAESDLTREIATMVQTKKFEQSFINEYLAWTLHDQDVERRGRKEGRESGLRDGRKEQALETARILKRTGIDASVISQSTGLSPEIVATL